MNWQMSVSLKIIYASYADWMISLAATIPMVNRKGSDIVIIANVPEGQVTHYSAGLFGKRTCACQYRECKISPCINKVIAYTEYPHPGSRWFEENEKIAYLSRWNDVIQCLRCSLVAGTKVALQMPPIISLRCMIR